MAGSLRQVSGLPAEALAKAGGAEGNQTPDLFIANEALYQLSYTIYIDPNNYYFLMQPFGGLLGSQRVTFLGILFKKPLLILFSKNVCF